MDNGGRAPSPVTTPRSYRCPACGTNAPLIVSWPWWYCPACQTRLVPADLHPTPEGSTRPAENQAEDLGEGDQRAVRLDPGTPETPVPEPNAPIAEPRRPTQSH